MCEKEREMGRKSVSGDQGVEERRERKKWRLKPRDLARSVGCGREKAGLRRAGETRA